ncbi:MAG: 2-pyrone-4,6-dicarboxylate hydrolase [Betaproteobacteria bacterium]|nr:2-pyrone-4,6-dicarboxylate hydrolase [Betaproteobacteria bacterium]
MSIFDEPKIDAHCHLLAPLQFPYSADALYKPQGQEIGDQSYFSHVMNSYGVQHALLVGPNSGYNLDNTCMCHALTTDPQRFKGIAVVPNDASSEQLCALQKQGVVGVAFNSSFWGTSFYKDIEPLLHRLKELNMYAQFQVEADQLLDFSAMIERSQVRVLIDHCGRPVPAKGVNQAGFAELLKLGKKGQAVVKISGFAKFSALAYPFDDTTIFVEKLVDVFGLSNCMWASDWPYLKASPRLDYGCILQLVAKQFSVTERHKLMWSTADDLFGFSYAGK